MKKLLLLFTLFGMLFLAVLCKPSEHKTNTLKPPVDRTIVKEDSEDFPKRKAREAWFERMHQAEEGVDWRAIEIENRALQANYKYNLRKTNGYERNTSETVANGNLIGRWLERGSINQAGSMLTVNYLMEDDMLYGLSAGGTLWKGDRSGFNWQVINQDYRFTGDLIEARYLEDGTLRIIANLNHKPVYSDDGGITWTAGTGIAAAGGANLRDFVELDNGDIFFLQRQNSNSNYAVYRSQDNGESWQRIQFFLTNNPRNLNLERIHNTQQLVIIEQLNTDLTAVYLWNTESEAFDKVTDNSAVGFGQNDRANINATYADDTLRMYVRNHEDRFFVSKDTARTWEFMSNLPTSPWAVGVHLSPTDHTKLMYGEVNPYRSITGGKFWGKVSNWDEYYGDIFTKLHADIMDIKEFKLADGTPFTIVCNHGGVSQSFDYGDTYENIGLATLNISQYYSVATHPEKTDFVFAGSQDQGFQRGRINGDDVSTLDQVISGDYGHIVFSGENNNLWTVYPWGWVTYYSNPLLQTASASWQMPVDNKSAWIPPMVAHPDPAENAIFIAGGSLADEEASHIIRLDIDDFGGIVPTQLPFDFSAFNADVSAIGISPFDYNVMYALTHNGIAYKSVDGGMTFERKEFGHPGGHYLYGSCILPSKLDPNIVYISGSGYSNAGVYKSIDGGETYQPMSNGLPNTMVFAVASNEDESLLFAATEAGPYVYITALDEWFDLSGVGTPNQTYWSVEYIEELQTARFGTYGRGIWDFEVEEDLTTSIADIVNNTRFKVYPNPFTDNITIHSAYDDLTSVSIIDQQGRLIQKYTNQRLNNLTLDLSQLNSGIYFVSVRINNNLVTEKIIKN